LRTPALLLAALLVPAAEVSAQGGPFSPQYEVTSERNLPAGEKPPALRDVGFDQRLGQPVPLQATFRDETGRTVRLGDYFGQKPVVLLLAYYECPMLCTLSLNGLTSALMSLPFVPGREFELVTVSFEPKETPELAAAKKRAYLRRYQREGAEKGWHFLTGDQAAIDALTRAVGFRYAWDEATKQWAHASGILVLTPDGRLSHYLYGVEYAPKDLRLALVEAGAGKVGSVADRLLLYCYHYDPTGGRYGAAVMSIVRGAGALTLAALVGFITIMRLKERTAARAASGSGHQE
jgi:protein SCO1/2